MTLEDLNDDHRREAVNTPIEEIADNLQALKPQVDQFGRRLINAISELSEDDILAAEVISRKTSTPLRFDLLAANIRHSSKNELFSPDKTEKEKDKLVEDFEQVVAKIPNREERIFEILKKAKYSLGRHKEKE